MKNEAGVRITDGAGIETLVREYYTTLFAASEYTPQQEQAETKLLDLIPAIFQQTFSAATLTELGRTPQTRELLEALKDMESGKSPRPDGILW